MKMNDDERRLWVLNDESLYLDMIHSRKGEIRYVRTHRAEIDSVIRAVLERKPK